MLTQPFFFLGDIALRFLDYCKNVHNDNTATVQLVDINPHMLGEGEKRFQKTPYANSKTSLDKGLHETKICY